MAFLDELRDRAMDLGRAGVAKSKQLAEITRLSLNNASEEDAIKKAYVEIGKLYYAERGMAPEAAYVSLCEKITAAKQRIEENKAKIADIKQAGSISDDDVAAYTCDCGCADEAVEAPAEEPIVVEPLADDKPEE